MAKSVWSTVDIHLKEDDVMEMQEIVEFEEEADDMAHERVLDLNLLDEEVCQEATDDNSFFDSIDTSSDDDEEERKQVERCLIAVPQNLARAQDEDLDLLRRPEPYTCDDEPRRSVYENIHTCASNSSDVIHEVNDSARPPNQTDVHAEHASFKDFGSDKR